MAMHRLLLAFSLALVFAAAYVAASLTAGGGPVGVPTLTTFDRWYGSTPIPDQWLSHTPSGWKVPVNDESLPWLSLLPTWPRMNATTVDGTVIPFVDEVATVRCLGGWDKQYGNGNASDDIIDSDYQFRWNLLDGRLDPWVIGANKSILLVLDNVPYVFTDGHPKLGPFGQDAPPVNYTKFEWFVGEVVQHLQQRYGAERVANRFRFRVGTEPDGPRYGNITQYIGSYTAAARAVKRYSPQSPVGAGNWLHQERDYADYQAFEDTFYAAMKAANVAVDFIAQSDYVQGFHHPGGRRYPCFITNGSIAMQNYARIYGAPALPRETQEFSPLNNVEGRTSSEPGSFGVAFYVACWTAGLDSGLRRIFHWGTGYEKGAIGALWTGYGWAMGMAELLVGQPVAAITRPSGCERGAYALSAPHATLVTAFDPYANATFNTTFVVPHNVSRVYRIDAATAPFDVMLRDAEARGYTKYRDGLPYDMKELLNAEGQRWIRQKAVFQRFVDLQKITFTPVEETIAAGTEITLPQFTTLMLLQ